MRSQLRKGLTTGADQKPVGYAEFRARPVPYASKRKDALRANRPLRPRVPSSGMSLEPGRTRSQVDHLSSGHVEALALPKRLNALKAKRPMRSWVLSSGKDLEPRPTGGPLDTRIEVHVQSLRLPKRIFALRVQSPSWQCVPS